MPLACAPLGRSGCKNLVFITCTEYRFEGFSRTISDFETYYFRPILDNKILYDFEAKKLGVHVELQV